LISCRERFFAEGLLLECLLAVELLLLLPMLLLVVAEAAQ
jgi:hypothetical protein